MAPALDAAAYPHLLDAVFLYAPRASLLALRGACRQLRDRVDAELLAHALLSVADDGALSLRSRAYGRVPALAAHAPIRLPVATGAAGLATALEGITVLDVQCALVPLALARRRATPPPFSLPPAFNHVHTVRVHHPPAGQWASAGVYALAPTPGRPGTLVLFPAGPQRDSYFWFQDERYRRALDMSAVTRLVVHVPEGGWAEALAVLGWAGADDVVLLVQGRPGDGWSEGARGVAAHICVRLSAWKGPVSARFTVVDMAAGRRQHRPQADDEQQLAELQALLLDGVAPAPHTPAPALSDKERAILRRITIVTRDEYAASLAPGQLELETEP
ncbi:hypothetical protein Q8F55_002529 [Vanrija albida]|uniref:F-box domain-containing protein n=1 Tax=Vanrija albida TaxID=181172 RepID=A0ABR3QA27_9TREE